jgi:hypothetical protein
MDLPVKRLVEPVLVQVSSDYCCGQGIDSQSVCSQRSDLLVLRLFRKIVLVVVQGLVAAAVLQGVI